MTANGELTARYLGLLVGRLLLLWGLAIPVAGAAKLTGQGVELRCEQLDARLECTYRLLEFSPVSGVTASVDGVQLPVTRSPKSTAARTALLFLVDTSDLERQPIIAQNIKDLKQMLEQAPESYDIGLASFDSDLRIEAPLGSARQDIAAAADGLSTRGPTTELYRNALEAIEVLSGHAAEQKVLVIFSDGMAEDKAYFHSDVIAAANEGAVVIYGLGYVMSETDSVALQTLRRLAEETGGVFVEADNDMVLPSSFLADPYEVLRSSGRLSVDLRNVPTHPAPEPREVSLVWILAQGTATASVGISTLELPAGVVTQPGTAITGNRSPPALALVPESATLPTYMFVIGAAAVAVMVALIAGAVWYFTRDRAPSAAVAETVTPPPQEEIVGILEEQEDGGNRYLISSGIFRIGRHTDNDLTLSDPSISRHHAEIERRQDGSFAITDLESMNGVFVNNRQHRKTVLRDGDLIELGDVPLRFVLSEESKASDEGTVLLTTLDPNSRI